VTRQIYEDYKYFLQDAGSFFVGSKYSLKEITSNEDILFKFRKVISESVIPHFSPDDTLETVLYYLDKENFVFQIFKQMNAEVRISVKEEKKKLFGGSEEVYRTKYVKITEFAGMTPEEKEKRGVLVQELKGSKLALLTV